MKSSITTALGIAVQIWLVAVLLNTVIDVVFISGLNNDFSQICTVAFFIFLIGGVFTLPIFFLLWSITDLKMDEGSSPRVIYTTLLIAGAIATLVLLGILNYAFRFDDTEIHRLMIIAFLSGMVSILISYPAIKNACHVRDTARMQIINFDAE